MKTIYEVYELYGGVEYDCDGDKCIEHSESLLAIFECKEDAENFKRKFERIYVNKYTRGATRYEKFHTIKDAEERVDELYDTKCYYGDFYSDSEFLDNYSDIIVSCMEPKIEIIKDVCDECCYNYFVSINSYTGLLGIKEKQIYSKEDCDFDNWDTSNYNWMKPVI